MNALINVQLSRTRKLKKIILCETSAASVLQRLEMFLCGKRSFIRWRWKTFKPWSQLTRQISLEYYQLPREETVLSLSILILFWTKLQLSLSDKNPWQHQITLKVICLKPDRCEGYLLGFFIAL